MGRKRIENINKGTETKERYEAGLEASELAKEDFQQGQEVVEGVRELDVDDEVKDVTTRVGEGIRQEAESFMRDEVGGIMEEGTELSNETEEHANENAELNHEAADRFAEVQDNRFGSKGELGQETAMESAEFFEGAAQDVVELRAEKMERYESDLAEITD